MSGGSYDYLYLKEIIDEKTMFQLEAMYKDAVILNKICFARKLHNLIGAAIYLQRL